MSLLSKNLRHLRECCGFTQAQLARACSIDRSTYSYYESGKVEPSLRTLSIICRVYHVCLDDIAGRDLSEPLDEPARRKAPVYADKQEIEMIFYFRLLSGLQRQNLIKYAEELSRADEACGKSAGERP